MEIKAHAFEKFEIISKLFLLSPYFSLLVFVPHLFYYHSCSRSYIISLTLFAKFMYHGPHDRVHYRALIISEVERLGNVSVHGEKIRIHDNRACIRGDLIFRGDIRSRVRVFGNSGKD